MLHMISYDLKKPGRDYLSLYQAIKAYGTWWHYLESTWIVKSESSPTDIANNLRIKMDPNDSLLVVDITDRKRDGWLPKKAWEWLNRNDGHPSPNP